MKYFSLLISTLAFLAPPLIAAEPTETKTLVTSSLLSGGDSSYLSPESVVLAEGDRAELVGAHPYNGDLRLTIGGVVFPYLPIVAYLNGNPTTQLSKIVVTGPATIQLHSSRDSFVTFDIHRAGAPSNAIPIPQEAGANFNVILESSSDLLNWTPANPGTYTGTEVKRFFRTRIVRLTP